jgi:ketosteroid isomerase-like protein
MSSLRIGAVLLAASLLLCGCGRGDTPQPEARSGAANAVAGTDPAAQIAAEEAQWNRDFAARDLERLVNHYAPDATVKITGAPPYTGRWVRLSIEAGLADPAFAISFAHDRIEVARSGDLGYSRGHYQLTLTDRRTGQPGTEYGTYLTVWQKQPDGRWRVIEDISASQPRPRPPM